LAKEAEFPGRFQGQMAVSIERFEVPTDLIDSLKSLKSLKIRFESTTIVLTNLTTFGVAVGATVLAFEV
jgi:hypothetical protein